ncbi:MAG: hypothetical protein K2K72_00855, partial [Duncaniella sp.]|nr:hypothetical protein [Duncaniella sp.]
LMDDNPLTIYTRSPQTFSWLPPVNQQALTTLHIGAGATRSNGRFAITMHDDTVRNRIAAAVNGINAATNINNSKYSLLSNDTEIHVVFSLGGGTGCGTFLNLAYLLRGMYPLNTKISGYALMADVFRSMVQGAGSSRVRSNAYGAIADLDYLYTNVTSQPVTIKWQKGSQTVNTVPFDALYFIDNKNGANYTFENSEPLCEVISLALVTSIGELSVATASVSDNVAKDISQGTMDVSVTAGGQRGGVVSVKKSWVAGFGVSEITFNAKALARIFINKAKLQIIDRLCNGGCDDPSSIANAWIDENSIRENLGKDDVIDYFMSPSPQSVLEDIDPAHASGDAETFFNRNARESAQSMEEKMASLKNRIELSLADLVTEYVNRECGVFNIEQILKVLINQIGICDGEMEEEAKVLEDELVIATSESANIVRELEDATGLFQGRKRKELCQELCQATMLRVNKSREIQRRQLARNFYNWLLNLLRTRLSRVDTILENLKSVYTGARNEIESIRQTLAKSSFFCEDLTISEVDNVECLRDDVVMNDFITFMKPLGGVSAFVSTTSAQVANWIGTFAATLPKAKKYEKTTIENILNGMDREELAEICRKAITKSLPLLPYNYKGYDTFVQVPPTDYYYVGVADSAHSVLARDKFLSKLIPGQNTLQFASTGLHDRVIIYHQLSVIPAFALEAIENYETEYESREQASPGGAHWDSGMYTVMKNSRFSIWPSGGTSEKAMEYWIEGLVFGLITYDAARGQYMLSSRKLGGRPLSKFMVPIGDTRIKAFNYFSDKLDEIKSEIDEAIKRRNVSGPENPVEVLPARCKNSVNDGSYLALFSQCPIAEDMLESYPEDYDLLNQEMEFILDNL